MKSYIAIYKKENIIYKLLTVLIMAVIVLFLFRVVKNSIVGLDYPNEILEPANVNLTNAILEGKVPYALENLVVPGVEEPPVNFEYPFMHSLFAALFSPIFGGNTIASHYFVSFISMIGTAILGSIIIFRYSHTTLGPTAGFLFMLFCHWRYGYISASPDGFGLFVAVLSLYLACRPNLKNRALWTALGTVAAFYSKQYFAFVCVSIFIYFLWYSKKEALRYFMWCVVILAVSMIIITWKWPLFWTYSVLLLMHGCFQGWNMAGFIYVLNQLKYFAAVFLVLIVVVVLAIIQKAKSNNSAAKNDINKKWVTEADELPLFLIQIPVQLVVLFIFGRNDGAYLTYFLQLLIPSILISVVLILESIEMDKKQYIYAGVYGFIIVAISYFGWSKLPMHMLNEGEIDNWKRAYTLVDEYRAKGDVYHYQATAYNAIEHGDSLMSTGHDGDISKSNYEEWMHNDVQQLLFPYAGDVYKENLDYREEIARRIRNRDIAMVVTEWYGNIYVSAEELESSGYTIKEIIPLQLGNMEYDTYFWVCD